MNTLLKKVCVGLCALALCAIALPTFAQKKDLTADLEISGWIPYWTPTTGTSDARKNLDTFSVLFPFTYSVKSDGTLLENADLKKNPWKRLITAAKKKDVLIIPTVMWSNTSAMHTVLSIPQMREQHIDEIVKMVKKGKFDGVDIDYEGKSADTYAAYATFLKELKEELGKKLILSCTIEARTPPEKLYRTMPADLRYANDFTAIAQHCDRVNIMTYDQQRAVYALNETYTGTPYVPIADTAWVRDVIELTLKTIPKEKLSLGIATYGHEYEVVVYPNGYMEYGRTGAFNPSYGIKTAKSNRVTPERNIAGELFFSFHVNDHAPQARTAVSYGASDANRAFAQSSAYTRATQIPSVFYYATWSDAEAIEEKIELAREYDLRGVAIFKIDGNEDKALWKLLK